MVCIYCGGPTAVTNSRKTVRQHTTWRRRRCKACQAVFTSSETLDVAQSLMIRRSSSKLEPFSRDTLYISVYESCRHRPSAAHDASALTRTIIANIFRALPNQLESGVIERALIIDTVLAVLNRFDNAAATHYTAYYARKRP